MLVDLLNPTIHTTLNWLDACEGSALCLLRHDTALQRLEGKEQCHVVMVPDRRSSASWS